MHFNFRKLEKYGRKVREKKSATHPSTQKQIPLVSLGFLTKSVGWKAR